MSQIALEGAVNRGSRRFALDEIIVPGRPIDVVHGNLLQCFNEIFFQQRDYVVLPLSPCESVHDVFI